jgi:HAD superfamily hydrolase (TIGR01549 family)
VGPCDAEEVVARYDAVRREQYRVNLPHLRENDLVDRLRLTIEPVAGGQGGVSPELLAEAVEAYVEVLVRALPLSEGTAPLLAGLKRHYRLGVITNYPYSPGTRRVLAAKGLASFFDAVVISADWEFVKPHPLLFRQAAIGLGVEVGDLVHVGDDWEADIVGATLAGARSVYFTGLREEDDPRRGDPMGQPLAIISDLKQLEPLLGHEAGPNDEQSYPQKPNPGDGHSWRLEPAEVVEDHGGGELGGDDRRDPQPGSRDWKG